MLSRSFLARKVAMIAKEKTNSREEQRREQPAKGRPNQLEYELEDSFPASDPPSITQPNSKPGARRVKCRESIGCTDPATSVEARDLDNIKCFSAGVRSKA